MARRGIRRGGGTGGARLPGLFTIAVVIFIAAVAAIVLANRGGGPVAFPTRAETPRQSVAVAASFPVLTGRVVDNADLIAAEDERALTLKLEAFETKSSDQVVVATIESLNGAVLEDYANRLFRHWGLGQAGENNGVLLLVAKNDRKIRIEVGYGLESVLTDALAKLIIENALVPAFRSGAFSRGILEGTDLILQVLSGDTAELEARARRNAAPPAEPADWFGILFAVVWFGIFFAAVGFSLMARIFGRKTGKNRYEWLGVETSFGGSGRSGSSGSSGSSGGGFSGGGGSSGGGGASGSW